MTKLFLKKQFIKASVFFGGLSALMSFSFMAQAESNSEISSLGTTSVYEAGQTALAAVAAAPETITPELHDSFLEQTGNASWYGPSFHGRPTASGEKYDMHDFTAAHRTLPFGTIVKVTNPANGKTALVRITDRGPFHGNRIIDLSYAAAQYLNVTVSKVKLEAFKTAAPQQENVARSVAFTAEKDAVIVPAEAFSPVDSLADFTDALKKQTALQEKMGNQDVFLTISKNGKKSKFYVGVLKPLPAESKAEIPSIVQVKALQ